jgi:hypothetical protein
MERNGHLSTELVLKNGRFISIMTRPILLVSGEILPHLPEILLEFLEDAVQL